MTEWTRGSAFVGGTSLVRRCASTLLISNEFATVQFTVLYIGVTQFVRRGRENVRNTYFTVRHSNTDTELRKTRQCACTNNNDHFFFDRCDRSYRESSRQCLLNPRGIIKLLSFRAVRQPQRKKISSASQKTHSRSVASFVQTS